ncbi:phospholipase [Polaromonas sp. YR568]|uniref:patatin-like phospholipase family protein n=1 Tax=Polaromonas sp. YR568 TaxID=1855301 RepID=UPI0031381108
MRALRIYAGPAARRHIEQHGLQPRDVGVVPGAAGGPKGLILGPLDRFIFGEWLARTDHPVHLVGASIGAWRMATACLHESVKAFQRLERDYIHQDYELEPGRKSPTAAHVSARFGASLESFYGGRIHEVLQHPRYRLHIVTSRGRHLLGREHRLATPLGYLGAFLTNSVRRKAMGAWLERVVFSSAGAALPFATTDYRTRQVALSEANFQPALQASCSIPFVLKSVHGIPAAPPGAYWDGGITDYHLHLDYHRSHSTAGNGPGLVLYPHFQKAVVPGWLDKGLKWRHGASHFLDSMVLLAPDPAWVRTLPNGKLPDRTDFTRYGVNLPARVSAWTAAAVASQQLADEWQEWLHKPDAGRVERL